MSIHFFILFPVPGTAGPGGTLFSLSGGMEQAKCAILLGRFVKYPT
jgi:hypothetical protein